MIYLDYAANTPADEQVLKSFCNANMNYIANPNAFHEMGRTAKERMDEATSKIAGYFGAVKNEVIYTSGASESNNMAIKGIASSYKYNGKHIISTCLEHSSVSGCLTYLQNQGYEIDLVDITSEGLVDINHLKELLRKDTVLVSVCYVDSELGTKQPIEEIAALLKEYPNCFFHVDATQAVGKIPVSFGNIDLLSFAPHKFYGLNGCGVLLKKEHIVIEPLIHGGKSTTIYRSGTPALGLAVSIEKALELSCEQMNQRYEYVSGLSETIKSNLLQYKNVRINSTEKAISYLLNLSVKGIKALDFQQALEQEGVCISTKSACSVPHTPSRPVYAVTKDKKNALSSWRISLSHLTTQEEIQMFLSAFDRCYHQLVG
ncbi:MAG: iscS 1, partial [Oscillospiraceae bacterium]|jgi:cysteine desulfurase|nr:iscS 1 [Oscillospiraceae bacterium]